MCIVSEENRAIEEQQLPESVAARVQGRVGVSSATTAAADPAARVFAAKRVSQ